MNLIQSTLHHAEHHTRRQLTVIGAQSASRRTGAKCPFALTESNLGLHRIRDPELVSWFRCLGRWTGDYETFFLREGGGVTCPSGIDAATDQVSRVVVELPAKHPMHPSSH